MIEAINIIKIIIINTFIIIIVKTTTHFGKNPISGGIPANENIKRENVKNLFFPEDIQTVLKFCLKR